MGAFGITESEFEFCRFPEAVVCKIVTAAVMLHQYNHSPRVVGDFLAIPLDQVLKIESLFKSFFVIYSVPRAMDVAALAESLRKFLVGKERRIDFYAFSRKSRRPSLEVIERRADSKVSIDEILTRVSAYLDVPRADILSDRRGSRIVWARRVAMFAARYLTDSSLPAIGRLIGKRDHTTVIHVCNTLESKIGGRPPPNLNLEELLFHIASRSPDVAAMHREAFARDEKREKAFQSRDIRDKPFLEAA